MIQTSKVVVALEASRLMFKDATEYKRMDAAWPEDAEERIAEIDVALIEIAALTARVKELETGLAWYAEAGPLELAGDMVCDGDRIIGGQRARAILAHRGGVDL